MVVPVGSLRVPLRKLSRHGPARLCHAPAETRQVMRRILDNIISGFILRSILVAC
jgi:hypothetical protein